MDLSQNASNVLFPVRIWVGVPNFKLDIFQNVLYYISMKDKEKDLIYRYGYEDQFWHLKDEINNIQNKIDKLVIKRDNYKQKDKKKGVTQEINHWKRIQNRFRKEMKDRKK